MIKCKKANIELRIYLFIMIFMIMINFIFGFYIDLATESQEYNKQDTIDDLTNELGLIGGFITSALINIGILFFGIFGIDFIASINILPSFLNSILVILNILGVFTGIFYLVDRLWVG